MATSARSAPRRIGPATDSREIAASFARDLKSRFGERVATARLFGSVARGDDTDDSDIDVLVTTSGDWFQLQKEVAGIVAEYLHRYGVYVSVKVMDESALTARGNRGFHDTLRREAVALA